MRGRCWSCRLGLRCRVLSWVNDKVKYEDINDVWDTSGGATQAITISFSEDLPASFAFGPSVSERSIVLGGVTIDGTTYNGNGSVTMSVTKSGTTYSIASNPTVEATMHDVFDFNYFKDGLAGFTGGPLDGAQVQCGANQVVAGAGEVALIEIELDGTVVAGPFTNKTP